MEALHSSLTALTELFNTRMGEFQQEINRSSPVTPSTTSLAAEFTSFRNFIISALETLQKQVEFLGREVDRMEMRRRRKMILLHGIPEIEKEDTSAVVASVISDKLRVPGFSATSISRSHRLGRSVDKKSRPIVVKFQESSIRDKVWYSKTKLKGSGITQSEFLTRSRHSVFMEARKRFGVAKCWTKDGCIHILAPDGSHQVIETRTEFEAIAAAPVASSHTHTAAKSDKPSVDTMPRTRRIAKK